MKETWVRKFGQLRCWIKAPVFQHGLVQIPPLPYEKVTLVDVMARQNCEQHRLTVKVCMHLPIKPWNDLTLHTVLSKCDLLVYATIYEKLTVEETLVAKV